MSSKPILSHMALLALTLVLMTVHLVAQEPVKQPADVRSELTDADPALFVLNDDDTTIYLFGTVHFLDGKQSWFDEAVLEAFEKSDRLVLEMVAPDTATMQSVIMAKGIDPEGPPLSETLSPESWDLLKSELEAFGIPAVSFESMDPWFAAITLAGLQYMKLELSPESGAEAILQKAAESREMPVSGLETFEYQIDLFDALPEEDQVAFLIQGVEQLADAEAVISRMIGSWSKGDIEDLALLMREEMSDETLRKRLLDDRNANWAGEIERLLDEPGTFFVAVGAGHLGGDGSVAEKLAARGIEVTRVDY